MVKSVIFTKKKIENLRQNDSITKKQERNVHISIV